MAFPDPKYILEQLYDKHLSACIIGILGGAITLIRASKKSKIPTPIRQIVGSLVVASFAAWLVSLILPIDFNPNYRTFLLGISGMSGERILALLEDKGFSYVEAILNFNRVKGDK